MMPLELTNEWNPIAKIPGIKLYPRLCGHYGIDAISPRPTNLYGPSDNNPENIHVVVAIIWHFHETMQSSHPIDTYWCSDSPQREFLHDYDLGDAFVHSAEVYGDAQEDHTVHLNVRTGIDLPIRGLALLITKSFDFRADILCAGSKPYGTLNKVLDLSQRKALDRNVCITLEERLIAYCRLLEG